MDCPGSAGGSVGSALRVASGVVAITTATALPVFLTGALAVQISGELQISPAQFGLAIALYFGACAVLSLPVGRIVERFGSVSTSRLAVLGACLTMLVIAGLARSYTALLAVLLCGAWSNVMGQLSCNLALSSAMPARRLGLSFGLKQASVPLATLLAGVAVPTIALTWDWRWVYVVAAGLTLVLLTAVPRGTRYRPPDRTKPAQRATGALAVMGIAAGLGAATSNALSLFVVASAVAHGAQPGVAGLVLALGSVVGLLMRLLHGWLADRRSGNHVSFVAASMFIGAGGVALLAAPGTAALIAGVLLGFGLGFSWSGLLQFAIVRLNPHAPASATSIVQVGVFAGGFGGPLGFGLLASHFGYGTAWLAAATVMALAAAGVMVGRTMLRRHRDEMARLSTDAVA